MKPRNALILILFFVSILQTNISAQYEKVQSKNYDCKESSYYFFHGNQLQKAPSLKEVINKRPWSASGQLYANGSTRGTAFYIGNRLVLTAAHCIGSIANPPKSFSFALAQYGPGFHCNPYGKIPVKRMFVPKEWANNIGGDYKGTTTRAYDFVVLELAYDIPHPEGFPKPKAWALNSWGFESIKSLTPHTLGYSNCTNAPGNHKYPPIRSTAPEGKIKRVEEKQGGGGIIIMTVEACAGMSGGPVFVESQVRGRRGGTRTIYKLIGVMVGSPQKACERGNIWAAALNAEIRGRIENIKSYLKNLKNRDKALTAQSYRKVARKMNVHVFDQGEYFREKSKCNGYLRN